MIDQSDAKNKELLEAIDQSRWLMNNGLANDVIKNQLMTYGAIAHPDITAVELDMNLEAKYIRYTLYVDKKLLKKINEFKELSESTGFWGLRKYKKMLLKHGNLHIDRILDKFIKDYCGQTWQTETLIKDFAGYVEGYEDVNDEGVNFSSGAD